MLKEYKSHVEQRSQENLPPLPLDSSQVTIVVELLKQSKCIRQILLDLLIYRVPPGVDQAAYIKAEFLANVARGMDKCHSISPAYATQLLGTMMGGYNVNPLIDLLDISATADAAESALSRTLLVYDAYHDVVEKAASNRHANNVIKSWANAEWFLAKSSLPESIIVTVCKVAGETNTDDLSPATEAWSRPDIPLHAKFMLVKKIPNILETIEILKRKGHPLAYVGDVVGTGSSRKSAINSILWHIGKDIPFVPNKRYGGVILGGNVAPIFFNTAEDSGTLPIECDVQNLNMGDVVTIRPWDGQILSEKGDVIVEFNMRPTTLADEVRAGGRIPLIIGRGLTDKACETLDVPANNVFIRSVPPTNDISKGFTLAQKIVGKACGVDGVRPGTYCEPKVTTVGSQDTTGAMTRDELRELACLGFSSDLVMQSFCHTSAYPKPIDIKLQHSLPDFISTRGGISLHPGDGVIHSWLNRMILPDTVGTGGDSHTRFPIGISFPAGSGLVAFAAALGVMPIDMPESVLVRFKGEINPGITLRDLVNSIPYVAIQRGLLTIEKRGKKNIFNGRILEIEGLPDLKVEQAFELSDASAERSANGCTVNLQAGPIIEFINSNISLLKWMIVQGYEDKRTLQRRIDGMKAWLESSKLLNRDINVEYAEIIEIDLCTITEPLLACPNDPDDIRPLSELKGVEIDEVFIGSCMTNIGHYRAVGKILENMVNLPTRLWVAPPTKMDKHQLMKEGIYKIFNQVGARIEAPGCSLCMGNQARVSDNATVVSTSTRNFPNRLGDDANVYLSSAELAAVAASIGRLPTVSEYKERMVNINSMSDTIYKYLNFNEMREYGIACG
ncbi:MAG: bifunctional aconitate hydratase 2/2-methylisocitrate dehydratase [Piscirickettsiaceae bacterium]|nr:bifunctional aconitate hydratase 2/2-methylisocitrate dehydratase [Piscirickettsiaceae bacterium]